TLPQPLHCQSDNPPPSTRHTSSDLDSARNTPPHPARFSAFLPSNHTGLPGIASLGVPGTGVPGTPYLTAWANSGKSGRANREQALRHMASRQARLEPLALSASGHERMVNGRAAASGGENGLDFPRESPGSVHNKIEGPLVE